MASTAVSLSRVLGLAKKSAYHSSIPIALILLGLGLYGAKQSDLFTVHVIEVSGDSQVTPVDSNEITRLAGVPTGKVSLFDLDFFSIEKRIRSNPWVDSVRLEKNFPQTLSIHVQYRKPVALVQHQGDLFYVGGDGQLIEKMSLKFQSNLPVLSGLKAGESEYFRALGWVKDWKNFELSRWLELDSIRFKSGEGFELLVRYRLKQSRFVRTRIYLGNEDISLEHWSRLGKVFEYLIQHQIQISELHGDLDKKIVVKTTTGS